jgi:hypothetical protein
MASGHRLVGGCLGRQFHGHDPDLQAGTPGLPGSLSALGSDRVANWLAHGGQGHKPRSSFLWAPVSGLIDSRSRVFIFNENGQKSSQIHGSSTLSVEQGTLETQRLTK